MKHFKILGLLFSFALVAFSIGNIQAQTTDEAQTSFQSQVVDTGLSSVPTYTIEAVADNPTLSDVIDASKAETFVDSLQAVANVIADPHFKKLLLETVDKLNDVPDLSNPSSLLSWLSAFIALVGSLVTFLLIRFGGILKNAKLNFVLLAMLSLAFLEGCASCRLTSNYDVVGDKVLGCVECSNVKQSLLDGASQIKLKILRLK